MVQATEEAEIDATSGERLVERGEDDLPHPGLHAPKDRSLEIEEHAEGELETQPCCKPRPGAVAALIGEGEVVHAPDDGRVDRLPGRTMARQPLSIVEMVDPFVASPRQESIGRHALDVR